jgi:DNA polymerase bacteriophage-type
MRGRQLRRLPDRSSGQRGARVTLWIDIETRSRTDLKKLGVYRYSEDHDFSILMAGWSTGGRAQVAVGHEAILHIPGLLDPEVLKVAHNAQFERVCLGTLAESLLDPEQWDDTAALAAEWGYPTGLADVAKALGAEDKDSAGKRLVKLFTMPNRDGTWNTAETHPDEWLDFIAYCAQDVDTLVDVHARLGSWPTATEKQVWVADQRINDRGMGIDLELCKFAAEAVEANKVTNKAEFTRLTGVENPNSGPQVKAWADLVGLDLPDLTADTVQALIDDPETHPDHVQVLELRQDLALAAGGKFTAALQVASPDSRIRGGFRFFGAHTGRWTGQRVQPQNLPRATVDDPEAAILDLKMGLGADPHTLKALVRSMFVGPFTVVDYAAIEARVLAWVAGEEWALQAFRDGRDIYVETAERMSTPGNTLTRFQGKVAVLALGYNGSVGSLRAMGADGTDEELMRLVSFWRKANSRIVRMWDQVGDAVDAGGPVGAGLVHITRNGTDMQIHLPSGRAISYHGVRWKRYSVVDPKTKKRVAKQGWVYSDPKRGGHQIGTYGGRLVENITQAIARDILAEALVRLEAAGYRTVGHVHDEVIVESEDLEGVSRLVTENPSWADGLPLDGEGFTTHRYRKG